MQWLFSSLVVFVVVCWSHMHHFLEIRPLSHRTRLELSQRNVRLGSARHNWQLLHQLLFSAIDQRVGRLQRDVLQQPVQGQVRLMGVVGQFVRQCAVCAGAGRCG
jgi:hypothetical protein